MGYCLPPFVYNRTSEGDSRACTRCGPRVRLSATRLEPLTKLLIPAEKNMTSRQKLYGIPQGNTLRFPGLRTVCSSFNIVTVRVKTNAVKDILFVSRASWTIKETISHAEGGHTSVRFSNHFSVRKIEADLAGALTLDYYISCFFRKRSLSSLWKR